MFLFFLVPRSWCSGFCVSQSIDFADLSDPVHPTPDGFENRGFTLKAHQMFSVHTRPKKISNPTITSHFGFVFEETRSQKSRDYRDVIVFEKLRFQNVFRPNESEEPTFLNSSGLKSVFKKLRFRDGLVCTVGLNVEIKLRFRDGLVCTVGLTVEIKLRFRDGLVWTVGLTVEIKLRFRDGLVLSEELTVETTD